jgi:hypothetical protein
MKYGGRLRVFYNTARMQDAVQGIPSLGSIAVKRMLSTLAILFCIRALKIEATFI